MDGVKPGENGSGERLLGAGDPVPAEVVRPAGTSPFFLTCEHGGRAFPARLGTLGVAGPDLERHIAWDIGAAGVASGLSARLDATLVLQQYSRLVVDCNRAPGATDFVIEVSEDTVIPGNRGLSDAAIEVRAAEIFHPYHDRIHDLLEARIAANRLTVVVSVHTCTPVYLGVHRRWHIGVMYEHDDRLARQMLVLLREEGEEAGLEVGDNEAVLHDLGQGLLGAAPRTGPRHPPRRIRDPPGPRRERGRAARLGGEDRAGAARIAGAIEGVGEDLTRSPEGSAGEPSFGVLVPSGQDTTSKRRGQEGRGFIPVTGCRRPRVRRAVRGVAWEAGVFIPVCIPRPRAREGG